MSQLVAPGQKLIEEQLPDGRRVYRSAIRLPGDLPDIFARFVKWAA